jgi:ubiquinone biosynthesis protein COQ9
VWDVQALALLGQPRHVGQSLKMLGQLMDEIWHQCGDQSSDVRSLERRCCRRRSEEMGVCAQMDWYAKRLALAMVYLSTGTAELLVVRSMDHDCDSVSAQRSTC